MEIPRRLPFRTRADLLPALAPVLAGGTVVAAYALSRIGCRCGPLPVSIAFALPFVALLGLAVLWARSFPVVSTVASGAVTSVGYVVADLLTVAGLLPSASLLRVVAVLAAAALVAAFPLAYRTAHRHGRRVLVVVLAILAVPSVSMVLFYAHLGGTSTTDLIGGFPVLVVAYAAVLAPAWVTGREQSERARWEAERARRATERAEQAVRAERARVLHELQVLVLADLASIGRQAEEADQALGAGPVDPHTRADARTALLSITAAGRDSLTAMRRLLGMLRTTEPDAVRDPQPTLDRLDELVDTHRRAGLDVHLTITGGRRSLPDDVDLAAYRLLQRLLGGCRTAVHLHIDHTDRGLHLTVRGDGGCDISVREWARMVGGHVTTDTGASTVEVWLPTSQGEKAA